MSAPADKRAALLVVYAFNLEIARVPWITTEPVMAEMRLQWWADTIDAMAAGHAPLAHDVAAPLAQLVRKSALPVTPMLDLIAARQRDIDPAPMANDALEHYIGATAGNVMWLAASTLGAPARAEAPVRDFAFASGVAALFLAAPALAAAGRPRFAEDAVAKLAECALARVARARAARRNIPKSVAPALRAGWMTVPLLRRARRLPARVMADDLRLSEFRRRARMLRLSAADSW